LALRAARCAVRSSKITSLLAGLAGWPAQPQEQQASVQGHESWVFTSYVFTKVKTKKPEGIMILYY
jgi:hypothetical protein